MSMVDAPLVELEAASFGYAERRVVQGVSLRIERGDVVALVGANASGKSTLVRGLLGLVEHQGGTVRLFGRSLAQFSQRARIGYVPQRHTLGTGVHATAREVVAVGRLPLRPWWRPAGRQDARIVNDALAAVGLADRAGEEVASFSGGQQRRVLIARALAQEPDLLVMDEPTAGVDLASQEVLAGILAQLSARGVSMLIVTHEVEALAGVITRIVCLDEGHVDFDGSPAGFAEHAGGHPFGADHHHDHGHHPGRTAGALATGAPLDRSGPRGGGA